MRKIMRIRLWLIEERERAMHFSRLPPERHPEGTDTLWIPRSQIERVLKFPPLPNGWRECEATVADWLAEKEGLG
jgi:hypothetical protein